MIWEIILSAAARQQNRPEEHFRSPGYPYICFPYELDGKQYPDDLGKSMPFPEFYAAMANGAMTKTSQIKQKSLRLILSRF